MYVMFLFLLSSFYCAASDRVSEDLSQYVLYPEEADPKYDVCERVRRHRRNSFCKELQSVIQEGAGPGHPTVAVEKLKWVVKGRIGGEGGVLHPDGKPILRYPEGGITQGEEVAAWPACLFTGSEYPSPSEETRFAEFIDTVRFWGGKETKTHPTQGVRSAEIAALINENYAKDGITSPVLGLIPYKDTVTPQEAQERGGVADPIDDEHYATLSSYTHAKPIITEVETQTGERGHRINSNVISRMNEKALGMLIGLVEKGLVSDPNIDNIRIGDEGNIELIDPENIYQSQGETSHSYGPLRKLHALLKVAGKEEMACDVEQLIQKNWWRAARNRLIIAGGLGVVTGVATAIGLYKLLSYYRLTSRINNFKLLLKRYEFTDSLSDREIALILLEQAGVSEDREDILRLFDEYVHLFRDHLMISVGHEYYEKQIRDIWWKDFSVRRNLWKAVAGLFVSEEGSRQAVR